MKNITLSQLVRNHPIATIFLNEKNIDYCCGGGDNLYQAIENKNYKVDTFLAELESYLEKEEAKINAPIGEELYSMDVASLIAHLENTHHRDERILISNVEEKLTTILSVHYTHHKEELIKVFKLFSDLKKELLVHFVQEEKEVFPLMMNTKTTDSLSKIEALEAEHEAAGDIIKELIKVTDNFTAPKDGCLTYKATYTILKQLVEDIFIHIYKENNILFERYKKDLENEKTN